MNTAIGRGHSLGWQLADADSNLHLNLPHWFRGETPASDDPPEVLALYFP